MNFLMSAFGRRRPSAPVVPVANTVFTNSEIAAVKAAEEEAAKTATEEITQE